MATFAYLRVSTLDQDLEKNKYYILQIPNDKQLGNVTWVEEKACGRIAWKNASSAISSKR